MKLRLILLFLFISALLTPLVNASGQIVYEIEREKVILDIQRSGIVYLRYNLTLKVKSGTIARYVSIGMPSPSFSVLEAEEIFPDGRVVKVSAEEIRENSYYAVKMRPSEPIDPGESRTYVVEVELRDFIYEDETNPGNAGLMFTPSWFNAPIKLLQVFVILPPGVSKGEVKNQPDYDNLQALDNGRIYLYWERRDLPPNYKFEIGVSFPRDYVEKVVPAGGGIPDYLSFVIGIVFLGAIIISVVAIVKLFKSWIEKLPYQAPEIFAESLGPNKNMAPTEVAYLRKLEGAKLSYGRILAVLIASLVGKGFLAVESLDPLRLRKLEGSKRNLRIYERRFLDCVTEDGSLDEDCLIKVIKLIHRRVERELSGYSRGETLAFYDSKVRSIWRMIEDAPIEEKLDLIKDNLAWLLTDPDFERNLKRALRRPKEEVAVISYPYPLDDVWIWWPRGGWTSIPPAPRVPKAPDTSGAPSGGVDVPVIPDIEKAADTIARSVEEVSSNIVRNIEDFADRVAKVIVPSRPRASRRRTASVSCACVSCACACACVSCACACAGGGVG